MFTAGKTEIRVKIAKPSEKLNDDVIIKTKTEINTKAETKAETESVVAAEKAIEEAKEEAAAKAEEKVKEVADKAVASYVSRFLNGTNDKTKEKVMEYNVFETVQFNIRRRVDISGVICLGVYNVQHHIHLSSSAVRYILIMSTLEWDAPLYMHLHEIIEN